MNQTPGVSVSNANRVRQPFRRLGETEPIEIQQRNLHLLVRRH